MARITDAITKTKKNVSVDIVLDCWATQCDKVFRLWLTD